MNDTDGEEKPEENRKKTMFLAKYFSVQRNVTIGTNWELMFNMVSGCYCIVTTVTETICIALCCHNQYENLDNLRNIYTALKF